MEMDCIRTQATLSALHDTEHVTDENAEAAREHCDECAQCRAFDSDLDALSGLPTPQAPPELVDRVMVAVATIASELTEAAQAAPDDSEPTTSGESEHAAPRFEWFTGNVRWGTFGALAVAACAIALFAIFGTGTPPTRTADRATVATRAGAGSLAAPEAATAPVAGAPAPTPAPARAPDYLTFNGRVYSPGSLLSDSTVATQSVGTVSTAFGGSGAPTEVPAYRSPLTDGSIVVNGPDGSRLYEPVVRMFSSVKYQLVAGNAVERFGVWPELPARFPVPASPDGSPTFAAAGGDALGVQTYTAKGVPQSQGFAVAPGTASGDPAGSNPNWTWWEPMLMP
jgi:hypothetical protein